MPKRTDTERLDWLCRNWTQRPMLFNLKGAKRRFVVGDLEFVQLARAIDAAMDHKERESSE